MNTATSQKGFSIIEVVLVLAIAGLIFLMVFIALPAVQRSQRDSARQTEVSTVTGAMSTYAGANNGRLPRNAGQISQVITGKDDGKMESEAQIQVVTTNFEQDKTVSPSLSVGVEADDVIALDEISVFIGYKCGEVENNGSMKLTRGSNRQAAVLAVQEMGDTGAIYCKNS
jgi:prepilin-type N-terminal cleavage/methylation domain-containing protein